MKRLITILMFTFIIMGYRRDSDNYWSIKESSPTIWLKFCSDIEDQDFDRGDASKDDDIRDYDEATFDNVIQTIIDDFNDVETSYLRLAVYPEDTDDPDDDSDDTLFSKSKAKERTIDICIQSSSNPFEGGHALPESEEKVRIGCEIVLSKELEDDLNPFIQTLTHEIGHCIGLAHPQSTRNSIMSYFNSATNIRLQIHDKIGITHMYSNSDFETDENNTFGLSCTFAKPK